MYPSLTLQTVLESLKQINAKVKFCLIKFGKVDDDFLPK